MLRSNKTMVFRRRLGRGRVVPAFWLAFGLALGLYGTAVAAEPALPYQDGADRVGVSTCSGPCHGRQAAVGIAEGAAIRGSEVLVWQDVDRARGQHARAYAVLLEDRAQKIARNLGLGAAHEAPECLSCHADAVSEAQRGEKFRLDEGVSCEACHGGAETWLASHYLPDATHAQNVAAGMFPTDDTAARARLCASCHFGSDAPNQFVTHRIMGAGHPRMSFELDLFTDLQKHHVNDDDYSARKPTADRAQVWAIGQALAFKSALRLFIDSDVGRDGVFPELYFFDCHACHRPISDGVDFSSSWRPNPGRPLGPGAPKFNDAALIMVKAAAEAVAPDRAADLDAQGKALHAAMRRSRSDMDAAAARLAASVDALVVTFGDATFSADQSRAILSSILSASTSAAYTDYAAAEQAVMAIDTLWRALAEDGVLIADGADAELDEAYAAVADPNAYDLGRFRAALTGVSRKLDAS